MAVSIKAKGKGLKMAANITIFIDRLCSIKPFYDYRSCSTMGLVTVHYKRM